MAVEDISHTALSQPHWQQTRKLAATTDLSVVLFVQDTTELDYTRHKKTQDLGHIGDGKGKGFLLHSCLAVIPTPDNPLVLGLAHQKLWRRFEVKDKSETRTQRANRRTESDVWAEIVEEIGEVLTDDTAPMWVSVGDRGSDVFSYIRRSPQLNWHCLLRICQDRVIETNDGIKARLLSFAWSMSACADKTIILRGRDSESKRTVELFVAWSPIKIFPPTRGEERKQQPQTGWCIRVWEKTTSCDVDALEWILFTTVPITSETSALTQVDWYSVRWVIEEDHKCLKTGCAVEQRQLTTAVGLERLLGFLAIIAVRLLQLPNASRSNPNCPAASVVPQLMLKVLVARLRLPNTELTLAEFWRALARLGGFIGRKSDGNPGWQTLWRGWSRLQDFCWGASVAAGGI